MYNFEPDLTTKYKNFANFIEANPLDFPNNLNLFLLGFSLQIVIPTEVEESRNPQFGKALRIKARVTL